MHYAAPLATYYLQLEDDIAFAPNWVQKITEYLTTKYPPQYRSKVNTPWRVINFADTGFIGKLFESKELHRMAQLLLLFYDQRPADGFVISYSRGMTQDKKIEYWKQHSNLFTHIGFQPSMGNQMPQPTNSGKPLFNNPPARIHWSMQTLPSYDGHFVYWPGGEPTYRNDVCNFKSSPAHRNAKVKRCWFWGKQVSEGDHLTLTFNEDILPKAIFVTLGHAFHQKDIIGLGAVEIATSSSQAGGQSSTSVAALASAESASSAAVDHEAQALCGGWTQLIAIKGQMEVYWEEGVSLPKKLPVSPIRCLRVVVRRSQTEWVIIRDIQVRTDAQPSQPRPVQ